jgi:hypothetical protein
MTTKVHWLVEKISRASSSDPRSNLSKRDVAENPKIIQLEQETIAISFVVAAHTPAEHGVAT